MTDENDYKMNAIDIYTMLAVREPDNPQWPDILSELVDNVDQLLDIRKKNWELDKENSNRLDFKTLQTSWELEDRSKGYLPSTHKVILKDPISWNCDLEYKADTLWLYHIEGDCDYGEMKLGKHISD